MTSLPRSGRVNVTINVSADIHITATVARRRVSRPVISEIGNLLYGGDFIVRRRAHLLACAGVVGLPRYRVGGSGRDAGRGWPTAHSWSISGKYNLNAAKTISSKSFTYTSAPELAVANNG
jgi:hypothetical protein